MHTQRNLVATGRAHHDKRMKLQMRYASTGHSSHLGTLRARILMNEYDEDDLQRRKEFLMRTINNLLIVLMGVLKRNNMHRHTTYCLSIRNMALSQHTLYIVQQINNLYYIILSSTLRNTRSHIDPLF